MFLVRGTGATSSFTLSAYTARQSGLVLWWYSGKPVKKTGIRNTGKRGDTLLGWHARQGKPADESRDEVAPHVRGPCGVNITEAFQAIASGWHCGTCLVDTPGRGHGRMLR